MRINYPQTYKTVYLMGFLVLGIVLLTETRLREDIKSGVRYTARTKHLLSQNTCPLCERDALSRYNIKVGYTFDKTFKPYKIIRPKIKSERYTINGSVPICEKCKEKFLAFRISDPSKLLLDRKPGFHRGLDDPYMKENIFLTRTERAGK